MKILVWNVNGIRAIHKKGVLEPLFKSAYDILCFQEVKASYGSFPAELKETDYALYVAEPEKKGYSGVCSFVRCPHKAVHYALGKDGLDKEGRLISVELNGGIILYNIYFPNGSRDGERLKFKMDYYETFLKKCRADLRNGRSVIVCGDLNTAHKKIDLSHPKENENVSGFLKIEREWIDRFIDAGFSDVFRLFDDRPEQYTWWDYKTRARERNIGWRLDYFFVSNDLKDKVISCRILSEILGSDHCPVTMEINI